MTADVARNQWVKRIRGRLRSFGVLGRPDAARDRYLAEVGALLTGAEPADDSVSVGELCGLFLDAKAKAVAAGHLTVGALRNLEASTVQMCRFLGLGRTVASLRPADFEGLVRSTGYGPTRLGNFCVWARMVFTWGLDQEQIDALPRYGRAFRAPGAARARRRRRAAAGANFLEAVEVRRLIGSAGPVLRAMILLGINGGLGNTDASDLPLSLPVSDLAEPAGWRVLNYPRPKTEVERLVPIWPETWAAIVDALAARPEQAVAGPGILERAFLTPRGLPWVARANRLTLVFRRELIRVGIRQTDKPGAMALGFYTLRRTFRTVADQVGDQHAAARIMGHTLPGMAGVYVQSIEVERLVRVAAHVRAWLMAD